MKLLPLLAASVLLAACSSEQSSDGTDSTGLTTTSIDGTTTEPSATQPTATTDGSTSVPATTVVATTAAPTTVEPCPSVGDTAQKGQPDVLTMSGMVGDDIRVGDHACFERVVIELLAGPGDFPGWGAEYVDDPVRLGESDEFTDIEGDATLLVRMGMWMPDMEGNGYDGPVQIFPTTVEHILELRQTENSEGITHWAIGLDSQYPFTVTQLSSPARLVIDFHVKE